MNTEPKIQNLLRGSIWRKWDLHIHSPLSGLNNQFPKLSNGLPDWDQYLDCLESLSDMVVIGITDYFSIEGYRKILEFRAAGRLQNVPLVLPNIEFRLDKVLASEKDGAKPRRLNLHVIFSNEITPEQIEEHFLRELKFCYEGNPQDANESWSMTRAQLEGLGRRLKEDHESFRGRSDFEIGCVNATVSPESIVKALQDRRSIFKDKYLIVFAEELSNLINWDGQDHQTRKVLLQGSDAIFSGNPNTRDWALGLKDLNQKQFQKEFKTLKPCIHGSDAHCLEDVARPAENRYCWIKADLTFEGLKQILYEPGERVFIGECPPKLKHDYQVIESVHIDNAPSWFKSVNMPLNRDLVTIIGGRGSGKSALAELIAFAGGSSVFTSQQDISDSFLSKASKKSDANPEPVIGASITLQWDNGVCDTVRIPHTLHHDLEDEKVKYLPQKFVERLCAPENTQQLQSEIERVIFQNLGAEERLDCIDFTELRDRKTKAINLKKLKHKQALRSLNSGIAAIAIRVAQQSTKEKELKQKRSELKSLNKQAPSLPPGSKEELKKLEALVAQKQTLEKEISNYNDQLTTLDTIETKLELFSEEIVAFNEEITALLDKVELSQEKKKFHITEPTEAKRIIEGRRSDIHSAIKLIKEGDPEKPSTTSLKSLNTEIEKLRKQLQLTKAKREEYEKFQADKNHLEELITSLEQEIKEVKDVLSPQLERKKVERLERYLDYFEVLKEEQAILKQLYQPLHNALLRSDELAKKLTFESSITYDVALHAERANEILDQRKLRYREVSLEETIKRFFNEIEEAAFSRGEIRKGILSFYNSFLTDGQKSIRIEDQLRKGRRISEFDDWFFGTEDFAVRHSLIFDRKNLGLLSPGEKGIVLLLLYLEAEKEDTRPLIIDQPDDNLDNLSVYPSLINYFRERKKTRQIIIITHNPNLVVNTDAEQIIVANFDGARKPKIRYRAGALEDNDPQNMDGIRENVCRILEGGTEAFQRREQKYSLPPM